MIFLFNRAVVENPSGTIFEGAWSRPLTLPAVCQSEYCWAVVLVLVLVLVDLLPCPQSAKVSMCYSTVVLRQSFD